MIGVDCDTGLESAQLLIALLTQILSHKMVCVNSFWALVTSLALIDFLSIKRYLIDFLQGILKEKEKMTISNIDQK